MGQNGARPGGTGIYLRGGKAIIQVLLIMELGQELINDLMLEAYLVDYDCIARLVYVRFDNFM